MSLFDVVAEGSRPMTKSRVVSIRVLLIVVFAGSGLCNADVVDQVESETFPNPSTTSGSSPSDERRSGERRFNLFANSLGKYSSFIRQEIDRHNININSKHINRINCLCTTLFRPKTASPQNKNKI